VTVEQSAEPQPARPIVTIAGKPASATLENVRELASDLVRHFVENVVPCRTLPGDALQGDVTAVTRVCLQFLAAMLDGRGDANGYAVTRMEDAAAQWAREGVPIDSILHSIHEGCKIGHRMLVAAATSTDTENLVATGQVIIEMLDTMTTTVSMAYLREHRAVAAEHHTAVHTLTSALLSGHATSTMARECGIDIAEAYHVVAVTLPAHPDESNPAVNATVVARRKLRRVQATLAGRCGHDTLALLSTDGGTILVPTSALEPQELDPLVNALSESAGVPITATCMEAATAQIPEAVDQLHELLDLVTRMGPRPGLHRFNELALEYQLTRPGPGRTFLASLLDPLDPYPELLETLTVHLGNDFNRQRTARMLYIHANTVDYRLKRIKQLTGFDPAQPAGLWYLHSALIARNHTS
jgi:sugar diacid utilization regulator